MGTNNIQKLADYGQSLWLDFISRPMIETGDLDQMIAQGLRGMTSNPAIFKQAITSGNDYDDKILALHEQGKGAFEIYDALTIKDIQDATDCFRTVFEATQGLDGYVSLEIDPRLARKAAESIEEGQRLFKTVNRPNVMIKVPATPAGYTVIEELIAQGINVNVTLIFSLEQYQQAAGAYIKGLKRLAEGRGDLSQVRSVASVFVSRIDTAVDKKIDQRLAEKNDAPGADDLSALKGQAAVANCRMVFDAFQSIIASEDFQTLKAQGAHIQRVLWASTGTKNPAYSDIKYITELISQPTVNTVPAKTLQAFLDHGQIQAAFDPEAQSARDVLDRLKQDGIDIQVVCADLLEAGIIAFEDAFNDLIKSIQTKSETLCRK